MDFGTALPIVLGVIGLNIIIRITWAYLENRNNKKNNLNGGFATISERLQRILDKLDQLSLDVRDLKR